MEIFQLGKPVSELSNKEIASILFQLSSEVQDRLKMERPLYASGLDNSLCELALALFDTEAYEGFKLIKGGM